jgi:hypothetical protein
VLRRPPLRLRLVVDHVEAHDLRQKRVQLRVRRRVDGRLEQGHKDVFEHRLEVLDDALVAVHVV